MRVPAERRAARGDLFLIGGCLLLSLAALVLPAPWVTGLTSALRATVLRPLVLLQDRATLDRSARFELPAIAAQRDSLARLAAVIESRKDGDAAASYTAKLLADPTLAAKKLGEEAIEAVIAATQGDKGALAAESADLIYHWLVVLAAAGVSLDDVATKLEAREGTSGLAEKASRHL